MEPDMFKTEETLGNSANITDNVTAVPLCTHSPQVIKEYCHKLIEICGKGGC
jgi:hypothetical protein